MIQSLSKVNPRRAAKKLARKLAIAARKCGEVKLLLPEGELHRFLKEMDGRLRIRCENDPRFITLST